MDENTKEGRELRLLYAIALLLSCGIVFLAMVDSPDFPLPTLVIERGAVTEQLMGEGAAQPINLNTATRAELESLPGVGEVLAGRILQYRQEMGGFTSVEELMNVSGIGEKTLERLRSLLTV